MNLEGPFASMDHCIYFSGDIGKLLTGLTRPGGYSANDIWTSEKIDGVWQEAVNMGPTLIANLMSIFNPRRWKVVIHYCSL